MAIVVSVCAPSTERVSDDAQVAAAMQRGDRRQRVHLPLRGAQTASAQIEVCTVQSSEHSSIRTNAMLEFLRGSIHASIHTVRCMPRFTQFDTCLDSHGSIHASIHTVRYMPRFTRFDTCLHLRRSIHALIYAVINAFNYAVRSIP